MAQVVKPPTSFWAVDHERYNRAVFLGGSIEQGTADNWQDMVTKCLEDLPVLILNPRRDEWDPTWAQDPIPGTPFYEQVQWELDGQEFADTHVYYFDPNTKSPITLLELGLYCNNDNVIVYCPKEFWRYGNVKLVCERNAVKCFETEVDFLVHLYKSLSK